MPAHAGLKPLDASERRKKPAQVTRRGSPLDHRRPSLRHGLLKAAQSDVADLVPQARLALAADHQRRIGADQPCVQQAVGSSFDLPAGEPVGKIRVGRPGILAGHADPPVLRIRTTACAVILARVPLGRWTRACPRHAANPAVPGSRELRANRGYS